jgi:hypothetical protein
MRITRFIGRGLTIVAASGALLLPSVAPAHADSTGLINYSIGNCGSGGRQVCSGYGQGVPVGLSSLTVAGECTATTPFVVDRTAVRCYLVGLNDGRVYLDTGQRWVTGNASSYPIAGSVPFQGYRLCVGAGWSTSTGGYVSPTGFVCI